MSEEKKTETVNEETKERKRYKFEIEPIDFEPIAVTKYISSIEFCKLVNEYFALAFSDFVGCTFEMGSGIPLIALYFDHNNHDNSNTPVACSRLSDNNKNKNNGILERQRRRDSLIKNGDRYFITQDGEDIITKVLHAKYLNRNTGEGNWKNIMSEIADTNNSYNYGYYSKPEQITKIVGIDPAKMCKIIYGRKEKESKVDYGVTVVNSLNNFGQPTTNYALRIDRAVIDNINKECEAFGIGKNNGLDIIRK